MTDFPFSDCIRATPSRTLLALASVGCSKVRDSIRSRTDRRASRTLSDRTLADIGLSRSLLLDPTAQYGSAAHG